MRDKNKAMLRPELARKISPWMVNAAELAGPVGKSVPTGVAAFFLYGGPATIGKPDHNIFVYLLGPWVCPGLVALSWSTLLAWRPLRTFRGSPLAEHSYVNADKDPAVLRLNQLLNSDEVAPFFPCAPLPPAPFAGALCVIYTYHSSQVSCFNQEQGILDAETYISTQQTQALEEARVPDSDEDQERSCGAFAPPGQGTQACFRSTGLPRLVPHNWAAKAVVIINNYCAGL
jgi:hypothetical protein